MQAPCNMLSFISPHSVYPSALCGEHYWLTLALEEVKVETFCRLHKETTPEQNLNLELFDIKICAYGIMLEGSSIL